MVGIEILLVGENSSIKFQDLKHKLEKLSYNVSHASGKEEAIKKARKHRPDLLLSYMLKDEDIIELADKIKDLHVPIICIGYLDESKLRENIPNKPFYLLRPSDLQELKSVIDSAFYRSYKELKESEKRYRSLFEYVSSCVAVYQPVDDGKDFIIKDFNQAAERAEQVKKEDILGKRVTEVFPGVKDFGLLEVLQRVYKTDKPEHFPVSHYEDDRISGWRDNFVYKLPSGEIVAVYEDMTEQKQLEEELMEREQLYRSIVETAHEGILISNPIEGIVYANPRFQEMVGYTIKELKGRDILEFLFEGQEALIEDLRRRCLKGEKVELTLKFQRKDGSILWTLTKASPLFDKQGDYIGNVSMHTDITDRKRALEDLKRSENYYRGIFENTGAATVIIDEDTTLLLCNRQFEKLSGYSKSELEGKKVGQNS